MNHNQQNTYIGPPIFPRVPVEILSEIFLRCVPDSYEELNADLSWIPTVSHVNRHWREVALACPELWTSIIFSKPKWVPVMLSRSKKAPLVIKVDLYECSFDILRLVLYGHLDNIQEVDICGKGLVIQELCEELISKAPRIERLSLTNDSPLPLKVMLGGIGQLTQFKLNNLFMDWNNFSSTRLTSLTLLDIPDTHITMSTLLSILSISRRLEYLSLDSSSLQEPGTPLDGEQLISLPNLATISMSNNDNISVTCCLLFLSYLQFPSSAFISVSCVGDVGDRDTSSQILDSGRAFVSRLGNRKVGEGDPPLLTCHLGGTFGIYGLVLKDPHGNALRHVQYAYQSLIPRLNIAGMIDATFREFRTDRIVELELRDLKGDGREAGEWTRLWSNHLDHFKQLRVLRIYGLVPLCLFDVLLWHAMSYTGFQSPSTMGVLSPAFYPDCRRRAPLPALQHIHLCRLGWENTRILDLLLALVWARQQRSASITRVNLQDCQLHTPHSYVSILRYFADFTILGSQDIVGTLASRSPSYVCPGDKFWDDPRAFCTSVLIDQLSFWNCSLDVKVDT